MKIRAAGIVAAFVLILFIISCESDESIEFKRYYSSGAVVYQNHCQNCHGKNGEGLSALIPPLTDSVFLKANKNTLACFIRSGLKGPVTIKGKTYDDAMPANDVTPMEIAQALTYITNSFGNKLGTIDEQQVQADLGKCR